MGRDGTALNRLLSNLGSSVAAILAAFLLIANCPADVFGWLLAHNQPSVYGLPTVGWFGCAVVSLYAAWMSFITITIIRRFVRPK